MILCPAAEKPFDSFSQRIFSQELSNKVKYFESDWR